MLLTNSYSKSRKQQEPTGERESNAAEGNSNSCTTACTARSITSVNSPTLTFACANTLCRDRIKTLCKQKQKYANTLSLSDL